MRRNQYEVRAALPDGSEGELLAFAQQKRLAFKEQVTLYADTEKQQPILGFKARQVIDLLGQIAEAPGASTSLRQTARSAMDSINRGVLSYSSVN